MNNNLLRDINLYFKIENKLKKKTLYDNQNNANPITTFNCSHKIVHAVEKIVHKQSI